MSKGVAIGIDAAASGVRAALVDGSGRLLASAAAALAEPARRSPLSWWAALEAALRRLAAAADLTQVRALAVDGASGTVLAVDHGGAPLGPASLCGDPADPAAVARIASLAPPHSGARGAASPLAKLPGLLRRQGAVRVLHQADWLAGRLLGRFDLTDENNALRTGYDPVAREWPDWIEAFGVPRACLPRALEPGAPAGRAVPSLCRALGLPPRLLVGAGTTEDCAAFLATGAGVLGDGVSALGATIVLKQLVDRPIFSAAHGVHSHRFGVLWLAGGASEGGAGALAARLSPSGLEDHPPAPGPADDALALHARLESRVAIEAAGYARLAALGGPKLASVRSVGDGARNAAWTALRARALGVDMPQARSEAASVGAASLALRALAA